MKLSRSIAVVVVLGAVVALVAWWPGRSGVRAEQVLRAEVPAALSGHGSSWYCAARDVGVEQFTHTVLMTSVDGRPARVRLEPFGEKGPGAPVDVTVPAHGTTAIDVAASLGGAGQSVMLESQGAVVVEHRFEYTGGADQAPCSTFSSDTWYFPAVVTTRDAKARLSLFNPFPSDAAVDVEVAFDTGVRVPTALSGIVVPAGTTKVVELGDAVQRRDQFAATVRARSGGVVAELANSFDGTGEAVPVTGLRLVAGTRVAAPRWNFSGGLVDATAQERVVVYNPNKKPVTAVVQVVPYNGLQAMPEPFTLEVPGLRYALIDLSKESRVPPQGYHAIDVEATGGQPIVVARSETVTAAAPDGDATPLRSLMGHGTTASSGSVVAAEEWVSTGLRHSDLADAAMLIHNPGKGIAVVKVDAVAADGSIGSSTPASVEVPAGDSVIVTAVQLTPTAELWAARVSAGSPVVVERLLVFRGAGDISLQPSVPVIPGVDGLASLGG